TGQKNIENRLEELGQAIGSDEPLVDNVMSGIDTRTIAESGRIERRFTMSRLMKFAAAAVIIIAVVLLITFLDKSVTPTYAIEQTVEAFENVRFLHLIRHDESGQVEDERWIEIGMDGRQIRYRQDTPPNFLAIEDGESTAVYHKDKNAVVIYDRKDKQYQWVGQLGAFLENLRQKGTIIQENDDYHGRPAHRVLWPMMSAECYIDPDTKLPIAIGDTEMSYEEPPAGTFEIVIPEGYAVVDMRPGHETGPIPEWLQATQTADECFNQATQALARGDYAEAAELFEFVVEHQSGRNWAWFWLGKAYYEQGKYGLAIEKFSKVIDMMTDVPYCNHARGLAYAQLGMHEAATEDLQVCLPWMVRALRERSAALLFEYADNSLLRYGKNKPSERDVVIHMINRLRIITGRNFGYYLEASAEENEQAIAAWEDWFKKSGQIKFTPDAKLIPIPAAPAIPKQLSSDPFLSGEISEEEAEAIEEFKINREKIEAGGKFEDSSTPLNLFLTILSCINSGDVEVLDRNCALQLKKMDIELTPEYLAEFKYFTQLDILRAPPAPENPAEGQFWPIYVTRRGESRLGDTLLPVFWNGKWMWMGNMGRPADWRTAVPKFKEILEQAGK
ncbi:MAG: tetratricopeptide repeat protein, partial [Phycisphaerae bacterium]